MILEVSWDNLWTLSFGLSQFHGHSSWLVCEVAFGLQQTPRMQLNQDEKILLPNQAESLQICDRGEPAVSYI